MKNHQTIQHLFFIALLILSFSSCQSKAESENDEIDEIDSIIQDWEKTFNIKIQRIITNKGIVSNTKLVLHDNQTMDTLSASLLALEISKIYKDENLISIVSDPSFDWLFDKVILDYVSNKIFTTTAFLNDPKAIDKTNFSSNIDFKTTTDLLGKIDSLVLSPEFIGYTSWNKYTSKNEILLILELHYKINADDVVTVCYEYNYDKEHIYDIKLK